MSSAADTKMEIALGNMLRIGVSIAAFVVLIGWLLYLAQTHGAAPAYQHFHGQPISPTKLAPIFKGVWALDSRSVIELGLLLLVATPVVRVVFCIAGFAAEKDRLYVLISSAVLAILIYSLFFRA